MVRGLVPFLLFVLVANVAHAEVHPGDSVLEDSEEYDHVRPEHGPRFNGHLAHYITMSKVTFGSLKEAKLALEELRAGTKTFLGLAKEASIGHARAGRQSSAMQSGDLGLITYDLLEEELAEVAFDIRNPVAKSVADVMGPICSPSGCSLMAVHARYRKSFFSDAWWEANQFCEDHNLKFSDVLQNLNRDSMNMVASVIWPHEHRVFKQLKLRQLKADVKNLNKVDPTTVVNVPSLAGKKDGLAAHHKLMKRRDRVFATMTQEFLEEHSHVFAMSIEQMIKHGLLDSETLARVDQEIALEEAAETRNLEGLFEKSERNEKIIRKRTEPVTCGADDGGVGPSSSGRACDATEGTTFPHVINATASTAQGEV